MATKTSTKCAKCSTKGPCLYVVLGWPALQRPLCKDCHNDWYVLRDSILLDYFKEYIGEGKVRPLNRT